MKKPTISVVLATYNEEKNLPQCLESVKDFVDEIIIVDGTSSDNTVEVAKRYTKKVYIVPNQQNFHINKQIAIDKATMDWVLQLDADERVTPELTKEIREVVSPKSQVAGKESKNDRRPTTDDRINGYWIPRKNWFLGKYLMKGGVYPDYTLRLYRKGKGHLPQKDVHEQAIVQGKVGYLKNPLEHMADPYFGRYLYRFDRYTDLIAKELKEKNIKKNAINYFKYVIILPIWWFLSVYIRHKGFIDGWQGFVWAFFSALRFPTGFIKFLKIN